LLAIAIASYFTFSASQTEAEAPLSRRGHGYCAAAGISQEISREEAAWLCFSSAMLALMAGITAEAAG